MKRTWMLISLFIMAMGAMAQGANADEVVRTAQLVNNYFMKKYQDPTIPTNVNKVRSSNLWTRAVYYEGLMALYSIDAKQEYIDYTDRWAEFHQWTARNGNEATNADDQCCQQVYLERYMQTGEEKMIDQVRKNLEHQMSTHRTDYWTWIDAIQMCMPVYTHMFKITGEQQFLDYAMQGYLWSRNTCGGGLFNTEEGLWWRDKDFVPPYKEADGSNCYWSRGSGWVYAALVRALSDLGMDNGRLKCRSRAAKKHYKLLCQDFVMMSEALLKCQREDGFWNPSLVCESNYGGKELTGTALFLYGLSWGVRNKILDEKRFRAACDKAWQGLANDCVHRDGFLGWVQGTGKEPSSSQPVNYTRVPDFEDYGTGCFLLGASEYCKLLNRNRR
ncbi:MAG: glycoside hydrolase family 88 protein [Prevotella sp.]|nr:glycoside hydrolase family 88 protein [Prevotella sp.]